MVYDVDVKQGLISKGMYLLILISIYYKLDVMLKIKERKEQSEPKGPLN